MHKTSIMQKTRRISFFPKNQTAKRLPLAGTLAHVRRCIDGATAVEYGLLAGLIALGIAGGLGALSDLVNLLFENVGNDTAEVARNINNN